MDAKIPATEALATPTNRADMAPSETATRVNGTVNEKASTPTKPQRCPEDSAGAFVAVVLLLLFMTHSSADNIVQTLENWILGARAGVKLPTSRELVEEYSVSPVTVRNAIHVLSEKGLVEVRPGVGVFTKPHRAARVADYGWQAGALGALQNDLPVITPAQKTGSPDVIALNNGYPDEALLPTDQIRRTMVKVSKEPDSLKRSPVRGLPELQNWFSHQVECSPRDVLIVNGTQSGLTAIFRSVVGNGQPLLVESPTYWGAILAAKQSSIVLHPVTSDEEGPKTEDVEKTLKSTGARVFYAQPHYANPHGRSWSQKRKAEILELVRKHDTFLIEDDWAHDFWFNRSHTPIANQDADGHVIYLRSLTKSVSPAVRVGAVIARGPVLHRITAHAAAEAMYTSSLLQRVALHIVSSNAWNKHLNSVRRELKQRRDDLLDALRSKAPEVTVNHIPAGGLNLWCEVEESIDVEKLAQVSESNGLLISPGQGWFPTDPTGSFFRLNFAGSRSENFSEAAESLHRAISEIRQ